MIENNRELKKSIENALKIENNQELKKLHGDLYEALKEEINNNLVDNIVFSKLEKRVDKLKKL